MSLTQVELHGGSVEITTGANLDIKLGYGRRLQIITLLLASKTLTLPPTSGIEVPHGMNIVWIVNNGLNAFTVVDTEATFSQSVPTGQGFMLHTVDIAGNRRFFGQLGLFY
jgi:hypothetical protein